MTRRDPHLDRRALFASAAAATLLAATGVSAAGLPRRGGRLRMALSGAARDDSWAKGDGLFMQVARQGLVFDTLTEVAADGTLRGELATHWRSSEDSRVWHFDLRQDVVFHDGAAFSAADVVASAQGFPDGVVQQTGRYQVRINLFVPEPDLPFRLSGPEFYIAPAHAMGSGIGTGLYRVTRFAPGQQLLTERVMTHYKDGTAGWFDEVELVSVPAEGVRAEALGGYLVDAADLNDPQLVAGLPDVITLPDQHCVTQGVSTDLMQPAQIGSAAPMDNLRAGERWWFG